jgi:hypothetical protein
MASGGTVEIDVELKGTQDVKEGFTSISRAGKSLAETVGGTNEKLAEGLGAVGESIFGFGDSLAELKGGFASFGQAGGAGFTALLGPIGAVATAALGLYEVYKLISGAALEAEENQAAMAAASADLQGKLEALAEKGVVLAADEMQRFSKMTILAQVAKEKLQFSQEKLTKKTIRYIEAEDKVREAQEQVNKVQSKQIKQVGELYYARLGLEQATRNLSEAEKDFNNSIRKTNEEQTKVSQKIANAEKKYIGYEETSAEFVKTKIKENLETQKSLKLAQAEANSTEKQFKLKKIEIEQSVTLGLLQAEKNKDDQKALLTQNKKIEDELSGLNAVEIANQKASFQRKQLAKSEAAKDKADRQKRANLFKQNQSRRLAEARMKEQQRLRAIVEESRIKQLEIESAEDSSEKQISLAENRYNTQLALAKDNLNLQKIARLEYENGIAAIQDAGTLKRIQKEKEALRQNQKFNLDNALFDAQQIENTFERENEILRLNYENQFILAAGNQEKMTELTRRYGIERANLIGKETDATSEKVSSFFSGMGRGLAEVAMNSIIMGESFKKGIGTLLQSLAKQAGVEALMETARGVATALNPLTASLSAGHFKAAAIFGGAAIVAGGAGAALIGGAGGAGGTGGGAGGIMGSSGTAPTIQREEATSSELTFNVNFSGAVIYDTKKAAEQALADRVSKVMNERRRGNPRGRNS